MRKKDKAVSADTAPVKKNRKKKILAVTATLLLVAAGAVLYDVVGPRFINHLVTFDCSGGEEIDAVRVKLGRKIELPEPVRQDYTFLDGPWRVRKSPPRSVRMRMSLSLRSGSETNTPYHSIRPAGRRRSRLLLPCAPVMLSLSPPLLLYGKATSSRAGMMPKGLR